MLKDPKTLAWHFSACLAQCPCSIHWPILIFHQHTNNLKIYDGHINICIYHLLSSNSRQIKYTIKTNSVKQISTYQNKPQTMYDSELLYPRSYLPNKEQETVDKHLQDSPSNFHACQYKLNHINYSLSNTQNRQTALWLISSDIYQITDMNRKCSLTSYIFNIYMKELVV